MSDNEHVETEGTHSKEVAIDSGEQSVQQIKKSPIKVTEEGGNNEIKKKDDRNYFSNVLVILCIIVLSIHYLTFAFPASVDTDSAPSIQKYYWDIGDIENNYSNEVKNEDENSKKKSDPDGDENLPAGIEQISFPNNCKCDGNVCCLIARTYLPQNEDSCQLGQHTDNTSISDNTRVSWYVMKKSYTNKCVVVVSSWAKPVPNKTQMTFFWLAVFVLGVLLIFKFMEHYNDLFQDNKKPENNNQQQNAQKLNSGNSEESNPNSKNS